MTNQNNNLFRKKSIESIESPESLNDYLKVTSPGIWMLLSAVICLLIGVVLWGVFGSIDTTTQVAVLSQEGECYCIAPYEYVESIITSGAVSVGDDSYALSNEISEPMIVSENTDVYLRLSGDFEIGDIISAITMADGPSDGVYTGTVITEKIKPMSLLLERTE